MKGFQSCNKGMRACLEGLTSQRSGCPAGTDLSPILPVLAKVSSHQEQSLLAIRSNFVHSRCFSNSGRGSLRSFQVFDQALAGGGAKSINFQELAADLAQITFDYPFRIPPCESRPLLVVLKRLESASLTSAFC